MLALSACGSACGAYLKPIEGSKYKVTFEVWRVGDSWTEFLVFFGKDRSTGVLRTSEAVTIGNYTLRKDSVLFLTNPSTGGSPLKSSDALRSNPRTIYAVLQVVVKSILKPNPVKNVKPSQSGAGRSGGKPSKIKRPLKHSTGPSARLRRRRSSAARKTKKPAAGRLDGKPPCTADLVLRRAVRGLGTGKGKRPRDGAPKAKPAKGAPDLTKLGELGKLTKAGKRNKRKRSPNGESTETSGRPKKKKKKKRRKSTFGNKF